MSKRIFDQIQFSDVGNKHFILPNLLNSLKLKKKTKKYHSDINGSCGIVDFSFNSFSIFSDPLLSSKY